jgi:hypothetical protein
MPDIVIIIIIISLTFAMLMGIADTIGGVHD